MAEFTPNDKKIFADFIQKESGIDLRDEQWITLEVIIKKRMEIEKFEYFADYYKFLSSLQGQVEFKTLLNALTVKETYFNRNPTHFITLKTLIKEKLKTNPSLLRIWSAACATGEEPYTIAILITENFSPKDLKKIEIIASDISTDALNFAKQGVYGKRSVRQLEKHSLERFFTVQEKDNYILSAEIKNKVKIFYHNLVQDSFPQNLDIIICRNVLIYFNKETTKKIVQNFYNSLKSEGYLILGHAESLYGLQLPFNPLEIEKTFVYKKIILEEKLPKKKFLDTSLLKEKTEVAKPETIFPDKDISSPDILEIDKEKEILTAYSEAIELFLQKHHYLAIEKCKNILAKHSDIADVYLLLSKIYANLGNFKEAVQCLEKALQLQPLSSEVHFLLGLIKYKENDPKEAEKLFKKAIFLNPISLFPHFYLANIYFEQKNFSLAEREYKNTISSLEDVSQKDIEESLEGYSKDMLLFVCEKNLEKISKVKK